MAPGYPHSKPRGPVKILPKPPAPVFPATPSTILINILPPNNQQESSNVSMSPDNSFFGSPGNHARFQCNIAGCDSSFVTSDLLRRHQMSVHPGDVFPCLTCGKVFSQKRYLNQHLKVVHSEHRFSCVWCSRTFSLKQSLQNHTITCHSECLE